MWFVLLTLFIYQSLCTVAHTNDVASQEEREINSTEKLAKELMSIDIRNDEFDEFIKKIYTLNREDDVLEYLSKKLEKTSQEDEEHDEIKTVLACIFESFVRYTTTKIHKINDIKDETLRAEQIKRVKKIIEKAMQQDTYNDVYQVLEMLSQFNLERIDNEAKERLNTLFILGFLRKVSVEDHSLGFPIHFFVYYNNQIKDVQKNEYLNEAYEKVVKMTNWDWLKINDIITFLMLLDSLNLNAKNTDMSMILKTIKKTSIDSIFYAFDTFIKNNNNDITGEEKIAHVLKYILDIKRSDDPECIKQYFSESTFPSAYYNIPKFMIKAGLADDNFLTILAKASDPHLLRYSLKNDISVNFIRNLDDHYRKKITLLHNMYKLINDQNMECLSKIIDVFKLFDDEGSGNLIPAHIYNSFKILDFLGNIHLELNSEELIAAYFSLVNVQKDQAYNNARDYLLKTKKTMNIEKIKQRIDDNFSKGYLKTLSDQYDEKNWQGHRNYNKQIKQGYQYPENIVMQKEDLQTKYGPKNYVYYPPDGDLHTIIISLYGGYQSSFCNKDNIEKPLQKGVMTTTVELGDCKSNIFQRDQLMPQNFFNTHTQYIRVTAEFITDLKKKYPNAKIILEGSSFGGFFIMSYAYFNQVQNTDLAVYYPWVASAFKKEFSDDFVIPKIDGIIVHDGAIQYMQKILKNEKSLYNLLLPMLIHQNFNDERVSLNSIRSTLETLNPSYLRFILSRDGSKNLMMEHAEDEITRHIQSGYASINLRGHFNNYYSQYEFNEEILHFIDMIQNNTFKGKQSDFTLNQTNRRLKLALTSDKDVQQFLSNLRDLQNDLGQKTIQDALKNIHIPEGITPKEAYDTLMEYISTKDLWKDILAHPEFQKLLPKKKKSVT